MKALSVLIPIFGIFSSQAPASEQSNFYAMNYSQVVACKTTTCSFGSVKLLEAFGASWLGDTIPALSGATLKEKFTAMIDQRIRPYSASFADHLISRYDGTYASLRIVPGIVLPVIKQDNYIVLPQDAELQQLAALVWPERGEKTNLVSHDLWSALSDEEKAGTVLQIMLTTDSYNNYGDLVRLVISDHLDRYDIHSLGQLFNHFGFGSNMKFAGLTLNYNADSRQLKIADSTLATNMGALNVANSIPTFIDDSYQRIDGVSHSYLSVQGQGFANKDRASVHFYHSKEICGLTFSSGERVLQGTDGGSHIIKGDRLYAFSKDGKIIVDQGSPVYDDKAGEYCKLHYND